MDINTRNAMIRLLTVLVAGGIVYAIYALFPDPTVRGAAAIGAVAVVGAAEQLIKPQ